MSAPRTVGLLAATGLRGRAATAAHFGAVRGAEQAMLPGLGVSSPVWKHGAKEAGIDAFHHLVYAGATGLAYDFLDRRSADVRRR